MAIMERTSADFRESIQSGFAFVDFYGEHCGPCRLLEPVIERVEADMPFVDFVKVNITANPDLADAYEVTATPTLLLTKDGQVLERHIGYMDEAALADWIGQNMYR